MSNPPGAGHLFGHVASLEEQHALGIITSSSWGARTIERVVHLEPISDQSVIAQAYDHVVLGRRSIRGFLPEPVPLALIEEILKVAMRAPTSLNTQPWNFHIVSGEPLDRIRQENVARTLAQEPPEREVDDILEYSGVHRERQVGVAKQLFAAMGIERHDTPARMEWLLRGFRQFDAPVSVFVSYDRCMAQSDFTLFDCGGVANAIVNAAWSRGLGCTINSQGVMYTSVVRKHAGIPDDQVLMVCIAMGWPDDTFPANAVVSRRKAVEEAARFVGFEE